MSPFHDSEICRSIVENLPTGVCVVDLQKKIVLWSHGAERITGHLRHEVIGHSCVSEALLHCDQTGCEFCNDECPVSQAMKTSQAVDQAGFLQHKAGYEIAVRVRAVPVRNQRGSIIGAVETFEEIQPAGQGGVACESLPGCTDEVTGVASTMLMRSHLRQVLATFLDVQVPFSVLSPRLEGFAHFRASFGPEAASSLLRVVARSLKGALWPTDFVGRWSDDQFVVILNGCDGAAVHAVGERVRRLLANDAIEWWGDRRSLPIAIGKATVRRDDTIESLLQRLQKSLDEAAAWRGGSSPVSGGASES